MEILLGFLKERENVWFRSGKSERAGFPEKLLEVIMQGIRI